MAKNVQATSGASGGKKKPTRSPRRRTRANTAKPAQANPAPDADDDGLDEDDDLEEDIDLDDFDFDDEI